MNTITITFKRSAPTTFDDVVEYGVGTSAIQISNHRGVRNIYPLEGIEEIIVIPLSDDDIMASSNEDFKNWYIEQKEKYLESQRAAAITPPPTIQ